MPLTFPFLMRIDGIRHVRRQGVQMTQREADQRLNVACHGAKRETSPL